MEMVERLGDVIWSGPVVVGIAVIAGYVSYRTRFVQVRRLPEAIFRSGMFARGTGEGTSPFEAVCTALAGTVGTGNIAGVALAISMGGPGAVFWMWVSALLGMGLKYAEICLAVKYRCRVGGEYAGGPMYYIKNGLGRAFGPLAVLFAVFGTLASFGLGNAMQVGSVMALLPGVPPMAVGAVMAALVLVTCRGGARGRGRVAALLVPLMAGVYILSCLGVIAANPGRLPEALAAIFTGALRPDAALGGAAGSALSWGFRRGLFSSEAGLGSSPIAHASAEAKSPADQGLMGIFEVFADTVVICTLTALAILCSGVRAVRGVPAGAELVLAALREVYGQRASGIFLAAAMGLFAFSSVVSWSLYGEKCAGFLFGPKAAAVYRAVFAAVTLLSPLMAFSQAVAVSDIATFFMLATNLLALALLAHRGRIDS